MRCIGFLRRYEPLALGVPENASTWQTILLGGVAGATILIGLPLARVRGMAPGMRAFLNALAAGILLFLLFDILENAIAPLDGAVEDAVSGNGSWAPVAAFGALFVVGLSAGLLSLLYLGKARPGRGATQSSGRGRWQSPRCRASASAPTGHVDRRGHRLAQLLRGARHRAVGYRRQAVARAAPGDRVRAAQRDGGLRDRRPAGGERRPALVGYLMIAGLVAGGPTFVGTIVGTAFTSIYVFVLFLALAAGAIIYVVAQLLHTGRRLSWEITVWGLLAGFILGLGTELVLVAAGACAGPCRRIRARCRPEPPGR